MLVTVDIPEKLLHEIKETGDKVENSIIHALEIYSNQKKLLQSDPLYQWANTPVADKENKSDVSENPDTYLYNL